MNSFNSAMSDFQEAARKELGVTDNI
jgi:hypothetical protein